MWYILGVEFSTVKNQGEIMKNREALQVAIAILSADIDDLIAAINVCIRQGETEKAFDGMQTVCVMTQARTKLRGMLARVEREQ